MGNHKFHKLDHPKILSDYKELNNVRGVARLNNISTDLVEKVLVHYNIPLPTKVFIKDLDPEPIIKRYLEIRNCDEVGREFSISRASVQKLLNRNNIKITKIKYTHQEMIDYYLKVKTYPKACEYLGVSETYLRDVLTKYNVPLQNLKRLSVGDVFGYLTIIKEIEPKFTAGGESKRMFYCECRCGNFVERTSHSLRSSGDNKSCGCYMDSIMKIAEQKRKTAEIRKIEYQKKLKEWELIRIEKEKKKKEYIEKYGLYGVGNPKFIVGYKKDRFTITGIEGTHPNKTFSVICECGTEKVLKYQTFIQSKSCGCLQVERSTIHGKSSKKDPERRKWYDRWKGMISRCYNSKMHAYDNYGGRGIRVCDRWREPNGVGCENYYNDIHTILGPQPSSEHSLDRIDNDGNYEISNLRWATNSEQVKNQRRHLKK